MSFVVKRIPEDQPFTVGQRYLQRSSFLGCSLLFTVVGGFVAAGMRGHGPAPALVLFWLAGGLAVFTYAWYLATSGPILAMGPQGLWMQIRDFPRQAVWLPWESIASVAHHVEGRDDKLVVTPHAGALPERLRWVKKLETSLRFADRDASEIKQAVTQLSADRLQVR